MNQEGGEKDGSIKSPESPPSLPAVQKQWINHTQRKMRPGGPQSVVWIKTWSHSKSEACFCWGVMLNLPLATSCIKHIRRISLRPSGALKHHQSFGCKLLTLCQILKFSNLKPSFMCLDYCLTNVSFCRHHLRGLHLPLLHTHLT